MSVQEQLAEVSAKYADLGKQIEELTKLAEAEARASKIDWNKMAGRMVMVRNNETSYWQGPFKFVGVEQCGIQTQFRIFCYGIANESTWLYCKPFDEPTSPNWIEHTSDKMPVELDDVVLIQTCDGRIASGRGGNFNWGDSKLIAKYTVLDVPK